VSKNVYTGTQAISFVKVAGYHFGTVAYVNTRTQAIICVQHKILYTVAFSKILNLLLAYTQFFKTLMSRPANLVFQLLTAEPSFVRLYVYSGSLECLYNPYGSREWQKQTNIVYLTDLTRTSSKITG